MESTQNKNYQGKNKKNLVYDDLSTYIHRQNRVCFHT